MPYHIKKDSILGSAIPIDGGEYYAGNNQWTNIYENRKIYENKEDADAVKATTVTSSLGNITYSYQPHWWKNSTVIEE